MVITIIVKGSKLISLEPFTLYQIHKFVITIH